MLGLPRRWIRQIGYLILIAFAAIIVLLVANRNNVGLDDYLPTGFLPSFFQPAADLFIVDIAIKNCFKIKSKNENCGLPSASEGLMGNLYGSGQWVKIDKDLGLGSSWYRKEYFSYKKAKKEALQGKIAVDEAAKEKTEKRGEDQKKNQVIVDIAISNPLIDSKVPENAKLKIPMYILKEFHSMKVYDDSHHEVLVEKQRAKMNGEKLQALTVDNDKSASNKINIKLEQDMLASNNANKDKENEKIRIEKVKEDSEADQKNQDEIELKTSNEKAPEEKQTKEKEKKKEDSKTTKTDNKEKVVDKKTEKAPNSDIKLDVIDDEDEKKREVLYERDTETSRHNLEVNYPIPTKEELVASGWSYKSNGIWLKYGNADSNAVTGIDILFGEDAVDPRPNWRLIKEGPLREVLSPSGKPAYISIRKGPRVDYKKNANPLKINKDGKFKILQVADLHFSTGVGKCRDPSPEKTKSDCKADPRTLKFLEKVLDLEKPDFVVLTGDQIFGDEAKDSETALFKALNPFIKRKIPFAVTMGNHDDEGSLSRTEIMSLSANLPYSMSSLGAEEVAGVGNYALTVEGPSSRNTAMTLFFLDTHKYSLNPKVTPGYDWLKESQLKWLEKEAAGLQKSIASYSHIHLSMAFFHIPLPEYRNLDQPMVGEKKEGITAPRYNSGARSILGKLGVSVASVGHDHCNDYCLQDTANNEGENKIWLCYGGGSGEGGYGGYGGYIRRMRVFDIDTNAGEIKSWKRKESEPEVDFDHQTLVSGGNVINSS
mmetsp:Transcript_5789/g.6986  ORF Transcript_5789/g.6986 Transcript_5789/m.6986 type:complete len:769 (-) Transcript_5789:104-2410(-)